MCLAVPGQIIDIRCTDPVARSGRVQFAGIIKEINLSFVPEAQIGDYVIVHVGFAISRLEASEAARVFAALEELEEATAPAEEAP